MSGLKSCPLFIFFFTSLSSTFLPKTMIAQSDILFIKLYNQFDKSSKAGALSCPKQSSGFSSALSYTLLHETILDNILSIVHFMHLQNHQFEQEQEQSIYFPSKKNHCSALNCMRCSSKRYTHISIVMIQSRVFSSSSDIAAAQITITGLHYTIVKCAALFL